jgi:hypothetical protein
MKDCEKIAAIQNYNNTIRTPPYVNNDSSDTFNCLHELSFVVVPGEIG